MILAKAINYKYSRFNIYTVCFNYKEKKIFNCGLCVVYDLKHRIFLFIFLLEFLKTTLLGFHLSHNGFHQFVDFISQTFDRLFEF